MLRIFYIPFYEIISPRRPLVRKAVFHSACLRYSIRPEKLQWMEPGMSPNGIKATISSNANPSSITPIQKTYMAMAHIRSAVSGQRSIFRDLHDFNTLEAVVCVRW